MNYIVLRSIKRIYKGNRCIIFGYPRVDTFGDYTTDKGNYTRVYTTVYKIIQGYNMLSNVIRVVYGR